MNENFFSHRNLWIKDQAMYYRLLCYLRIWQERGRVSGEAEDADCGEDSLELLGDGAVDEEVGGEVDHDQEVRHALQTHDPPGRDVLVQQLHASHLHICNILSVINNVINI